MKQHLGYGVFRVGVNEDIMTKQEFIEEVKKDMFNLNELAEMALQVTDCEDIFEVGQNMLQEVEDAEQEFVSQMKNRCGVEIPISN